MALTNKLSAIGDAIRVKTGTTELLTLDQMPSAISSITTASEPNLEELTVTANGIYIPTESDGYSKVTVKVEGGAEAPYTSLWENGTWEEISAVLTQYYNGEITDLSPYFRVGDIRNIASSGTAYYNNGGSGCAEMAAVTKPWVIIGIQHDDLSTPTDAGVTKTAITIIPYYNYENTISWKNESKSSSSASNVVSYCTWSSSQIRYWLVNLFYESLEENCKNLIKTVKKLTARHNNYSSSYREVIESTETIFLLSISEMFGVQLYTNLKDGEQYEWFKNGKYGSIYNRVRFPNENKENSASSTAIASVAFRNSLLNYSSSKYSSCMYHQSGWGYTYTSSTNSYAGRCMGMCL